MKFLNSLSEWFAYLQPRERLIITVGSAVLIVAAIYMALLPAIQKNAELAQRYKSLSEDMQWLREQSEVVSRLNSSCSGKAIQNGKKKELITRLVRRNQLKLLGFEQMDSALFSFSVSGSNPNQILQLNHQLTCQGLALESLVVNPVAGDKVVYAANIEVINVD
ncbi:MAG: type II secretion system protein GspM [Porticoccaceae bacterium]